MEKQEIKTRVAIVVPKNYEGYLSMLCIENYLESKSVDRAEICVLNVTPCQLKLLQVPEGIEEVYVAGLGYRNCDPKAIARFLEDNSERLAFWADNHPQDAAIPELENNSRYRHGDLRRFPSCVSLLQHVWGNNIVSEKIAKASERYEREGHHGLCQTTVQMLSAAGFMIQQ